jgi:hypothetical protein
MDKLKICEIFSKKPGDKVRVYEEMDCWPMMCASMFESGLFVCRSNDNEWVRFDKIDQNIHYPAEMKILNGEHPCIVKKDNSLFPSPEATEFRSRSKQTKVWFTNVD